MDDYYVMEYPDWVTVIAITEDGNYVMEQQYRHGIQKTCYELCGGTIEKGENPMEAAKRELKEETGYVSDCWTRLMTIPSNATISDNYAHIFRAENCRPESEQHLDETEVLRVVLLDRNEMESLIAEGEFQQSVHGLAWLLALRAGRI